MPPSFSSLPSQHTLPTAPIPAHLSKITKTGSLPVSLPDGIAPKKSIQYLLDNNVPMLNDSEDIRPSVESDRYVPDNCVFKHGWAQKLHDSYSRKEVRVVDDLVHAKGSRLFTPQDQIDNTHVKAMETIQPAEKRQDYVDELATSL